VGEEAREQCADCGAPPVAYVDDAWRCGEHRGLVLLSLQPTERDLHFARYVEHVRRELALRFLIPSPTAEA